MNLLDLVLDRDLIRLEAVFLEVLTFNTSHYIFLNGRMMIRD
jgi:hypothetical protein